MCDICGRPVASNSPHAREGEKYDYDREASMPHEDGRGKGRHMACHNYKIRVLQKRDEEARARMTPAQIQAQEDEEARLFNEGATYDPRTDAVLTPPPLPVVPRLLKTPAVRVEGPPPNDNPDIEALRKQEAEYEARIQADFLAQQAEMNTQ